MRPERGEASQINIQNELSRVWRSEEEEKRKNRDKKWTNGLWQGRGQ
jgi:hypothetical protein